MDDDEQYRSGGAVRSEMVRMIDADGRHLGLVTIEDAFRLEAESGLSLVEISPRAAPPVWKLIDFAQVIRWREAN